MKKILVTLFVAVLLISVVGCNKTPPDVPDNTDKDKENISIEERLLSYDSYDVFEDEIYLCDDVYRSDETLTYGTASIALPMGRDVLEVKDYDILLCGDGCSPESVVSRASQGYAPAYRVVPDGEIDGNFKTLKFKMKVDEAWLNDTINSGINVAIEETLGSKYFYLLVLDEKHYAYIQLDAIDGVDSEVEHEAELADSIVKNAIITFEPKNEKLDLTLERVIRLAENKGEELTWSDFQMYNAIETGSGLYILVYEIDETFDLMIGGSSPVFTPMYIRLVTKDDWDNYIDIRTEDVEKFISDVHNSTELCGYPKDSYINGNEKYTIEVALEKKIQDGKHNADVKLNKVIFKDNDTLTETVNNIIYEPFYSRYVDYSESVPVDFNFFRGENLIYESEELLSMASLSYNKGTYVVYPNIAGAVIDLRNNKLLTAEEVLQWFNITYDDVFEEVKRILLEKHEKTSPKVICDLIGAYLNPNGELIVAFSTDQVHVDMPANPTLYYNVTTKAICTHPSAESFDKLEALFSSLPEDYVFDQKKYDEYYDAYDRIVAQIPKYKLDASEIKSELAVELEESYAAGKTVTVVIGTVTETNQYLWFGNAKLSPTDSDLLHTTFTFVMPNHDVKLRIEQESVDIPLAPPDTAIETNDTLTETDIEQIALEHCKHNYDYIKTTYDAVNEKWQVEFWENGAKLAAQRVTLDSDGNLLGTWFAE